MHKPCPLCDAEYHQAEAEQARKTGSYWKENLNLANTEIDTLRQQVQDLRAENERAEARVRLLEKEVREYIHACADTRDDEIKRLIDLELTP